MIDIAGMMGVVSNPQQTIMQYAMQGMISQHPREWKQVQKMFGGKSHGEQVKELRKLYKSKGMDLDSIARQYGISI